MHRIAFACTFTFKFSSKFIKKFELWLMIRHKSTTWIYVFIVSIARIRNNISGIKIRLGKSKGSVMWKKRKKWINPDRRIKNWNDQFCNWLSSHRSRDTPSLFHAQVEFSALQVVLKRVRITSIMYRVISSQLIFFAFFLVANQSKTIVFFPFNVFIYLINHINICPIYKYNFMLVIF